MTVTLRRPHAGEIDTLQALCMRSKAYWGYDEAFMELCRPVLRVKESRIDAGLAIVAECGGRIAGVAQVSSGAPFEIELLFVDPPFMGYGVGAALFAWAEKALAALGVEEIHILSDPGARAFYEHMGAVYAGDAPSDAVPGRMLPKLTRRLAPQRGRD